MQVVKLVDGIERTLGWRVPGQIFGEVPIAFGTTFAGGYRASEPSRVLRVDPKEYYAVAAAAMHVSLSTASSRAVARARRKSPPTKRSPSRERVQPNPSR
jgi:hypothetical protein